MVKPQSIDPSGTTQNSLTLSLPPPPPPNMRVCYINEMNTHHTHVLFNQKSFLINFPLGEGRDKTEGEPRRQRNRISNSFSFSNSQHSDIFYFVARCYKMSRVESFHGKLGLQTAASFCDPNSNRCTQQMTHCRCAVFEERTMVILRFLNQKFSPTSV